MEFAMMHGLCMIFARDTDGNNGARRLRHGRLWLRRPESGTANGQYSTVNVQLSSDLPGLGLPPSGVGWTY